MSFLPIVERELRTAARKSSTYRARSTFAVLTSLLAAGLLLVGDPASAKAMGAWVFPGLAALAFVYCLWAGARHAADCLSEEKREGTLGLLFLTDLHGYDVVAGKLVSTSARSFQGLFAIFPVLAIGLILGGITAGEFWRMTAVLTNTLFFSVAAGLWISSISRTAHRALAGTLGLLGLLMTVPLGVGWIGARLWPGQLAQWASCLSPATAARCASDVAYQVNPPAFWAALGGSHLLGWGFLALASAALPGSWQERPASSVYRHSASNWRTERSRKRLRTRLLDGNPIEWLAARDESRHGFVWLFTIAVALATLATLPLAYAFGGTTLGISSVLSFGIGLVLKLWVGWRACATFAEARRTGLIELLLATPLKVPDMIHGQWQALQRIFLWPVIAALALRAVPAFGEVFQQGLSVSNRILFPFPAMALFGMATLVLDLVAVAWVGMWMGLTETRSIQALAKTILFAVVLPAIAFCLPNILFDLFWIAWARQKLERDFRKVAAEGLAPASTGSDWLRVPPVIARP